jgi:splicing factor 3B subunit 1
MSILEKSIRRFWDQFWELLIKAIVNVIGMTKMTPPIKDLLPRLTPIMKNRHEKVQKNCIDLVGRIADRGAEFVPAREWIDEDLL